MSAFLQVMFIIASMCSGVDSQLMSTTCTKRMSMCVDETADSYSVANLEAAYLACLRKEAWKN
jgi:hypothetical protein